jgi:hypothetical protein
MHRGRAPRAKEGFAREQQRRLTRKTQRLARLRQLLGQQEKVGRSRARQCRDDIQLRLRAQPHCATGRGGDALGDAALRRAHAGGAYSPVMPAPISAGRFGIARTMDNAPAQALESCAMRNPATMDSSTGRCCEQRAVQFLQHSGGHLRLHREHHQRGIAGSRPRYPPWSRRPARAPALRAATPAAPRRTVAAPAGPGAAARRSEPAPYCRRR